MSRHHCLSSTADPMRAENLALDRSHRGRPCHGPRLGSERRPPARTTRQDSEAHSLTGEPNSARPRCRAQITLLKSAYKLQVAYTSSPGKNRSLTVAAP